MTGEIDPLDFVLAEHLGQTLQTIRALPNLELEEWRARLAFLKAMREMGDGGH